MLIRVSGLLAAVGENAVELERDGAAREVLVPQYALGELAACRGRTVTLHTLEYLEGNVAGGNLVPRLIGFLHAADRAFFELFITVKGIGVRKGLRALEAPVGRIAGMIETADTVGLSRLSGIGRRTAEQIVAELRGKVGTYALAACGEAPAAAQQEFSRPQRDAIEVLVAWGDARHDAQRWVARAGQIHGGLSTADEWVRAAYRIKTGAEG